MKKDAVEILKKCVADAENHPEFLGWRLSDDQIDEIGGDAALITYDFAYMIKKAIDILELD